MCGAAICRKIYGRRSFITPIFSSLQAPGTAASGRRTATKRKNCLQFI